MTTATSLKISRAMNFLQGQKDSPISATLNRHKTGLTKTIAKFNFYGKLKYFRIMAQVQRISAKIISICTDFILKKLQRTEFT
jgi:hypothetical protein